MLKNYYVTKEGLVKKLITLLPLSVLCSCASTEVRDAPTVISKASPISCDKAPQFPVAAVRKKIEGWVLLEYTLDQKGYPIDMAIVDSSPKGYFEKAALESYSTCRFKATQKIAPNEKLQITLDFKYS